MTFNKKKKKLKNEKEEREESAYYDIVRTSERKSTVIPKLADGEEHVSFDCTEAETCLRRCIDPMIAEVTENIKWYMNDKSYFSDFLACYARMLQVFVIAFSFAIYVQRHNTDGAAYLALKVIEPGTFPLFEGTVYFQKRETR